MIRRDVYKVLDTERAYQERETANPGRPDMIEDFNMGTAMQAINSIMRQADQVWYADSPENNYEPTMELLRKVAGVCVQMGEKYGMPKRKTQS